MKNKNYKFLVLSVAFFLAACGAKTISSTVGGDSSNVTDSSENVGNSSSESKGDNSSANSQTSSQGGQSTSKSSQNSQTSTGGTSQGGQVVNGNGFTFGDDIAKVQEIHTANQKKFLQFTGDYYNITPTDLNNFGASGTSEASFPNQVKVSWQYSAPEGKTVRSYKLVYSRNKDLSNSITVNGSSSASLSFYNPFLGDNYFKVVATLSDNSTAESPVNVFKVDSTAPRNLKIDNMSNCRDMGGRPTEAGGMIKQGLLYRTSDPSSSGLNVTNIKEVMVNQFGCKSEIYVKDGNTSSGPLGSSVKYFNASMDYGATPYSNMSRNAERLRKVFSILADENNYPSFYHCRIGTDRTGICAITINGLLGVSFQETIADYAFSNFGKIDGQRYAHKPSDPNGDDIVKYVDEILSMPGKTFQEKMYNSLLSIGIPAAHLNKVIDIMTEGPKANLASNSYIGMGDNLTAVGATKKTASDFTNPDVYYTVSSGKSVKYTVTINEAISNAAIVTYLGCTNSSQSTKLNAAIGLKVDGADVTVTNDKTYYLAGFGTTSQSRRTGYMFNQLAKLNLAKGEHTIEVLGKNSDQFNIGTIGIYGETAK